MRTACNLRSWPAGQWYRTRRSGGREPPVARAAGPLRSPCGTASASVPLPTGRQAPRRWGGRRGWPPQGYSPCRGRPCGTALSCGVLQPSPGAAVRAAVVHADGTARDSTDVLLCRAAWVVVWHGDARWAVVSGPCPWAQCARRPPVCGPPRSQRATPSWSQIAPRFRMGLPPCHVGNHASHSAQLSEFGRCWPTSACILRIRAALVQEQFGTKMA